MIENCSHCRPTSAGEHELTCPLHPKNQPTQSLPRGLMGWQCPVCGRGVSPDLKVCPCQKDASLTSSAGAVTLTLVEGELK